MQRQRLAIQQVTLGVLRIEGQPVQGEVFRGVDRMGPGHVPVEADIDQWQAGQGSAHYIEFAGDGQVHFIKAHAADPWKMRVGQQHRAPGI